jgi:hypothetical protein
MPRPAPRATGMNRWRRWVRKVQRKWDCFLLRQRGWPDPAGTLDWLEARNTVLRDRNGHEQ